jgi:hypothetical protein
MVNWYGMGLGMCELLDGLVRILSLGHLDAKFAFRFFYRSAGLALEDLRK